MTRLAENRSGNRGRGLVALKAAFPPSPNRMQQEKNRKGQTDELEAWSIRQPERPPKEDARTKGNRGAGADLVEKSNGSSRQNCY